LVVTTGVTILLSSYRLSSVPNAACRSDDSSILQSVPARIRRVPNMAQSNDKSEPYRFHGVALKPVKGGKEKQYIGDCPLCGKQDHFFVTGETGQFQCKVCNEAGNIYSFFQKIHAEALKRTKRPDWERLASLRGLPWSPRPALVCLP